MRYEHLKYFSIIAWLALVIGQSYAEEPRKDMLGSGNTYKHKDRNGLLTGAYSQEHHLFGVYADGSYSTMFTTMPNVSIDKGYGVGGGICYEFQYIYFKMQLGLGIRWQDVTHPIADTLFIDHTVQDARGYDYHLHYNFHDRVDCATNLHAQVPILFGAGYSNWYFLAGIKLNLTLYGATKVSSVGTTAGTYDQYLGYFYEMDNHGLRKNVPMEYKGKGLELRPDVMLSFETGYEWAKGLKFGSRYNPKGIRVHPEYRLRIAAFVDFGILNTMPKSNLPLYDIPNDYKWDFPAYHASHVFSTHEALNAQLHNFYAGIKLTALIGGYSDHPCRLCHDYTTEVWMSSPNIRQKKWRRFGNGK